VTRGVFGLKQGGKSLHEPFFFIMILKQRPQMKRVVLLVILVNIIVASALECQPSSVYGRSLEEMSDPTYILNFDDQDWTNAVHTALDVPLVLEAFGFTFTISGESCQIQSEATMFDESTTWDGNNLWDGLDVGSVGYFLTATTNTSSCTIEFSPPISEIFLFAMCGATDSCIISVYDSDDTQLNCGRVVNSPGYNTHWNWGMTGYKQIAKLVFTGGKGAIDEIIVRQGCGAGSWWNQGQCEGKPIRLFSSIQIWMWWFLTLFYLVFDACSLGYCDYYANCTSFGSDVMSPLCTCAVGYFGDGFFCQSKLGTKSTYNILIKLYHYCSFSPRAIIFGLLTFLDVNECEPESGVSPCPNNTLCDDNYGSFSCYCDPSIFEYDIGSVDLVCEGTLNGNCQLSYFRYIFIFIYPNIDINECDSVVCVPEATCHNFYGGYECRCPEGFVGDGSAFTGVGCTCKYRAR
jgi:hypothetical protein